MNHFCTRTDAFLHRRGRFRAGYCTRTDIFDPGTAPVRTAFCTGADAFLHPRGHKLPIFAIISANYDPHKGI